MKLHTYFRSSAAYRVRIALALKGVAYESVLVHLLKREQKAADYLALNPQGRVPALETDAGDVLVQSPAILEWIEETFPTPALLPGDATARAKIRAVAALVGCDIHPLNNLPVLGWLKERLGADQAAVDAWYAHWIREGFAAIEQLIEPAPFAFGAEPTMADLYIVPQVYNARRFSVPLDDVPRIRAVVQAAEDHPAFRAAAPEAQPDAA